MATNPDSRPLPDGWISQHDPGHNAWFYVNTKAAAPAPQWDHPLGPAPAPGSTPAPSEPVNPDSRPLPPGWISQFDPGHKAWFYVHTTVDPPVTLWTHPNDSQPAPPAPATPSHDHNPDNRPLPESWITQYDKDRGAWFYVDTSNPQKGAQWEHPADSHPPAAPHTPSTGGPGTPAPTGPKNPDARPLPHGWVEQHDPNHGAWFYVNTNVNPPVTVWEHPAGPAAPHPPTSPPDPYGAGHHNTGYGHTPAPGGYGAPQQHQQQQKDPFGGLLGGSAGKLVGGLVGGKAGKMLAGGGGGHGSSGGHGGHGSGGGGFSQLTSLAGKFGGSHGGSHHGAPPHGAPGYGAPPPQGGYAPSGQHGYGSPPPNQYGAPQQGYGAPPPQGGYGAPQHGQSHGSGSGVTLPGGIKVPAQLGGVLGKFGKFGK